MSLPHHTIEQHDPERKDFQVDRIILFSDAVFAIAITLLIIDIKPPEIHKGATDAQMLDQLSDLIPRFIGFLVSFFVVAIYWRSHHRIFGFVSRYNDKLIWINIWFLLTIVMMPFSSSYYSENFQYGVPYYFYTTNIVLTGIANFYLMSYVFNAKNQVIKHFPDVVYLKKYKARALVTIAVFITGMLMCPFFPLACRFIFVLVWPALFLINKYYNRKYRINPHQNTPITHKKTRLSK